MIPGWTSVNSRSKSGHIDLTESFRITTFIVGGSISIVKLDRFSRVFDSFQLGLYLTVIKSVSRESSKYCAKLMLCFAERKKTNGMVKYIELYSSDDDKPK